MNSSRLIARTVSSTSITASILFLVVLLLPANGAAQLRVVSYNTALSASPALSPIFEAIGNEQVNGISKPIDILALQEQVTVQTTTRQIVDILNELYGAGTYAASKLNASSFGGGRPALVYNMNTVQLIDEKRIATVGGNRGARQTMRYQLRPVGYSELADVYIYNSHFKGLQEEPNPARRAAEATAIRNDADSLGQGISIIYAGDFNIYSSTEPAYEELLSRGNGQAFDPLATPGNWHDSFVARALHTQSTTERSGENRAGGGMDDRFDFQLVSEELMDGRGLSYIGPSVTQSRVPPPEHSYHAFGNNGSHTFNGNLSTGNGSSSNVLNALELASDHLPVVADYQLPARMRVSIGDVPRKVIVGATASVPVTVQNAAPVTTPFGADRLEFALLGMGAVHGAFLDDDVADSVARQHALALNTETPGRKVGKVFVGTTSPSVPVPFVEREVSFDVLEHAVPSWSSDESITELSLDFGDILIGSGDGGTVLDIFMHNLAGSGAPAADLVIVPSSAQGDVANLTTTFPASRVSPGGSAIAQVALDTQRVGDFAATWKFATADEDLIGGAELDPLVLHLAARVVDFPPWKAGDANQDFQFDQRDIIKVLQSAKYLSAEPATWGEGDWDGATTPNAENPPVGNGVFDQRDLVVALGAGQYLQGPYSVQHFSGADRLALRIGNPDVVELFPESGSAEFVLVPEPSALHLFFQCAVIVVVARIRVSRFELCHRPFEMPF